MCTFKKIFSLKPTIIRSVFICWISVLSLSQAEGQTEDSINFLMVKYGDEAADQQTASDFLRDFSTYLQKSVPTFKGKTVRGWIANTPELAEKLLAEKKPILAFVPPGFYLAHLRSPENLAILQVPRFGAIEDRYYLVTSKKGPANVSGLQNKIVRTVFAFDLAWLQRVVFPQALQPGEIFQLEPAGNLGDEVFLLIENGAGERGAAMALLFDEDMKRFFETDEMAWPELKVIWMSEKLPRDIIVTVGDFWQDENRAQVRDALVNMPKDERGKQILELMQSSGFVSIDRKALEAAARKYEDKN